MLRTRSSGAGTRAAYGGSERPGLCAFAPLRSTGRAPYALLSRSSPAPAVPRINSREASCCSNPRPGDHVIHRIRAAGASTPCGGRKLSQHRPQPGQSGNRLPRSGGCGTVREDDPQGVEELSVPRRVFRVVHRPPTGEAVLSPASPQRCPLFGNATRPLTGRSESGHTKAVVWAVGKVGIPVGEAVGKSGSAVHRVCVTSRRPQKPSSPPPLRPQGRWTKSGL